MSKDTESQDVLERLDKLPFSCRFHTLLVLVVFVAVAFDNMDQVTLSFVIPQLSKEWGLAASVTRILPAAGITGTLIGAIIGGLIADRIGRKKMLNLMILVFAVTELANGFAESFLWVVTVCFIMGIGVGGAVPIAFSMISEFAPTKSRGIMLILTGVISIGAGYIIASAAAYSLMPFFGWRMLFAIGVTPAFLIPLIQKYIPESPRYLISKGKFDRAIESVRKVESIARVGHAINLTVNNRRELDTERIGNVKEIWSSSYRSKTALIWIYGALWGFFNFSLLVWLPTFLITSFKYLPSEAAYYTSIIDLTSIPVGILTAMLFEKVGRKRVLAAYPVLGGLATIALGIFGNDGLLDPLLFVLLGVVIYSTGFALAGMFPSYASELYGTRVRASGTGWGVGISRIAGVLGLLAGGGLIATHTSPSLFFGIVGTPLVVAGLALAFLGIETKQKRLESISPREISEEDIVTPVK